MTTATANAISNEVEKAIQKLTPDELAKYILAKKIVSTGALKPATMGAFKTSQYYFPLYNLFCLFLASIILLVFILGG